MDFSLLGYIVQSMESGFSSMELRANTKKQDRAIKTHISLFTGSFICLLWSFHGFPPTIPFPLMKPIPSRSRNYTSSVAVLTPQACLVQRQGSALSWESPACPAHAPPASWHKVNVTTIDSCLCVLTFFPHGPLTPGSPGEATFSEVCCSCLWAVLK